MTRRQRSAAVAALVCALAARDAGAGGGRELVVASEALRLNGDKLAGQMDAFLRRVEASAGWPAHSLRGRAFTDPADAVAYVKRTRAAFAVLPLHQFVRERKALGLQVLGQAVELEGPEVGYWGLVKRGTMLEKIVHIETRPNLRLAGSDVGDARWLSNVVFDSNVDAGKHFKLQPVKVPGDAVASVMAGNADVALVYEHEYKRLTERLKPDGDLVSVFSSPPMPPPPLLATRYAAAADRKALAAALAAVCAGHDGGEICARLDLLRLDPGRAAAYDATIEKYGP